MQCGKRRLKFVQPLNRPGLESRIPWSAVRNLTYRSHVQTYICIYYICIYYIYILLYIYIYIYNRIEQCALPVTTIMALWQLVNLGTRCTVYDIHKYTHTHTYTYTHILNRYSKNGFSKTHLQPIKNVFIILTHI